MELEDYTRTDPHLLVGIVNTALRNHHADLEDLCKTHDLDAVVLLTRLLDAGYEYLPEQNRFR